MRDEFLPVNDSDEIRLPDGRTLRYRRDDGARGGLRASTALRPQPRPARGHARSAGADADEGRGVHLDIVA